jgi:hypothetical protein
MAGIHDQTVYVLVRVSRDSVTGDERDYEYICGATLKKREAELWCAASPDNYAYQVAQRKIESAGYYRDKLEIVNPSDDRL